MCHGYAGDYFNNDVIQGNVSSIDQEQMSHQAEMAVIDIQNRMYGNAIKKISTYNLCNYVDDQGNSMLFYALYCQAYPVIEYLLKHGADTSATDNMKRNVFEVALSSADAQAIKMLCAYKAHVMLRNKKGLTPLHLAVYYLGSPFVCNNDAVAHRILKDLIDHGASLNVTDGKYQRTPVHYAIMYKNTSFLKLFVECYADKIIINQQDAHKRTALHYAMMLRYISMIRILMLCDDIDPFIRDWYNETPYKLISSFPGYQIQYVFSMYAKKCVNALSKNNNILSYSQPLGIVHILGRYHNQSRIGLTFKACKDQKCLYRHRFVYDTSLKASKRTWDTIVETFIDRISKHHVPADVDIVCSVDLS
jgi:ankyrin repeat protein